MPRAATRRALLATAAAWAGRFSAGPLLAQAKEHASADGFDCEAGYANWTTGWSEVKQAWCCKQKDLGCKFNCTAGCSSWEFGWSEEKQSWCREHKQLGCPLEMSDQPYDCQIDYESRAQWPQEKKDWCCYNKQLGCFLPTTAAPPAATSAAAKSASTAAAAASSASTGRTGGGATHAEGSCFEDGVTREPLDMPGTVLRPANDSAACQQMCADTKGCIHFSFWWMGGHCHLQDAYALRQTGRLGFISGPQGCWDTLDEGKYIKAEDNRTFVTTAYRCAELGVSYSPLMGLVSQFSKEGTGIEAIKKCRAYCASTEGCKHYTMVFPERLCRMAGAGALRDDRYQGAVSGTPTCWDGAEHDHALTSAEAADLEGDGRNELIMKASLRGPSSQRPASLAGAAALLLLAGVVVSGTAVVLLRAGRRRDLAALCSRGSQVQSDAAAQSATAAYATVELRADPLVTWRSVE